MSDAPLEHRLIELGVELATQYTLRGDSDAYVLLINIRGYTHRAGHEDAKRQLDGLIASVKDYQARPR